MKGPDIKNNLYFLIIITILSDKCNGFRIYKCVFSTNSIGIIFIILVRLILLICVLVGVGF